MYDLDLVEVLFKDQCFSRSDMSRMRNSMVCMTLTLGRCYFNRSDMSRMRNSMVCMTLTLGICYLKTNTSIGVT